MFTGGLELPPADTEGRLKFGRSHNLYANFQVQRGLHPNPMLFGGQPHMDERLDEKVTQF